ncbi:cofilin-2-like [Salarias fasciatus]|uniref:cofilin-2-like n=1 Tax=Salarias fasciatus TaxID=181472 RepID=UPI001176D5FD|nr:cofilin-2-like [Salarias fasciatus]
MASGVTVDDKVIHLYNDMKQGKFTETADGKKIRKKAVLLRIDGEKVVVDPNKEILSVDGDEEHEDPLKRLVDLLPEKGCRYAFYDAAYETEDTKKCKAIIFIMWAPDSCEVKEKMLYASSKEGVKKKFEGIRQVWQVNGKEDLDCSSVADKLRGHGSCLKTLEGRKL